jgi:hypothetical protein
MNKEVQWVVIGIYFTFSMSLWLASGAYAHILKTTVGDIPLPALTESVLNYSWVLPLTTLFPVLIIIRHWRKPSMDLNISFVYLTTTVGLAVAQFCILIMSLPLPFIYPITSLE